MSKTRTNNIKRMEKLNASNRYARKEKRIKEEIALRWRRLITSIIIYGVVMLILWIYLKFLAGR
jgi:hypothetical protein